MDVGQKITKYRKERGMTQKELAFKASISPVMLNQYEKGKRKPKKENTLKIAKALYIPAKWLHDDYDFVDPNENISEEQKAHDIQQLEVLKKHFENKKIETIISNFNSVNEDGKQKIVDYSSDIADNPKYKKDK